MIIRAYFGNGNAASALADVAAKRWGGATILNGMGRYIDSEGTLRNEIAWIVEVLTRWNDDSPVKHFRKMAQKALDDSSEETVLITWGSQVPETLKNKSLADVGS